MLQDLGLERVQQLGEARWAEVDLELGQRELEHVWAREHDVLVPFDLVLSPRASERRAGALNVGARELCEQADTTARPRGRRGLVHQRCPAIEGYGLQRGRHHVAGWSVAQPGGSLKPGHLRKVT